MYDDEVDEEFEFTGNDEFGFSFENNNNNNNNLKVIALINWYGFVSNDLP